MHTAAWKQARELEQQLQGRLVDGADVVIATCISSGGRDLAHGSSADAFTHVLMDEAAQAANPNPNPSADPSPSPDPDPDPSLNHDGRGGVGDGDGCKPMM